MPRALKRGPQGTTLGLIAREGLNQAMRDKRSTIAIVAVVALVVAVVLATTGRTAATERSVVTQIESLGARIVVLTDGERSAEIDPASVAQIAGIEGVSWAFGVGPAESGYNADAPQAQAVTTRQWVGELPDAVELTAGRLGSQPGEAVAGSVAIASMRLGDVAGGVTANGHRVGVVGEIHSSGMLDFLNETVLYRADRADQEPVVQILFAVDDPAQAQAISDEAVARLIAERPEGVTVEVSSSVIALSDVVSGKLGQSSRQVMALVLLVGLAITTVVALAMVAGQRRNFGRMRALGASRSALVTIVLVHSGAAAGGGAVLGVAAGLAVVGRSTGGELPAWTFVAGVAVCSVVIAVVGAVVPAIAAARRDPVSILRVP